MTPSSFINRFPYWIERRPNTFVAHMDDFPDFTFSASTVPELVAGIQSAFLVTLENYLRAGDLPQTHDPLPGEEVLILTPTYAAKVMLIIAFKQQKLTTQEFARRLGCLPQEGSRLLKLTHPTKIDTLHAAFATLGIQLYCMIDNRNPPPDNQTSEEPETAPEAQKPATKPKAAAKTQKTTRAKKSAKPRS